MDALHGAHLFALGLWGGLALAEVVLEAGANAPDTRRAAAVLHHRLDLLLEVPLLLAVVGTGAALLARVPAVTPALLVKVGAALGAVLANLVCVALVVARRRALADDDRVARLSAAIRWTGAGFPLALVALVIGLAG